MNLDDIIPLTMFLTQRGVCLLYTSEVMDFSVEHGYSCLRILAGNEEQCANSNCLPTGFTPPPKEQARPLCQDCVRIRCFHAIGVSLERKADSPNY